VVVATGVVTTIAGSVGMTGSSDGTGAAARFNGPGAMVIDGAGNLYVADNFTIRQVVVATGVVTTLAGIAEMTGSSDGTGAAARFNQPGSVAVDGAGNLYVADYSSDTIRQVVVATGVVTTLAGTAGMAGGSDGTGAAARFNQPEGVAVDGASNLYVADYSNYTIRKVVVATGVVTTLAGTAGMGGSTDGTGAAARFDYPEGVAVDGAGNLYVADFSNSTIRKIVLQSGVVTTFVGVAGQFGVKLGPLPGGLNGPSGVAALPNGELFITDSSENVVLAAP
jgi:sugar lactone lactonase YvrE